MSYGVYDQADMHRGSSHKLLRVPPLVTDRLMSPLRLVRSLPTI